MMGSGAAVGQGSSTMFNFFKRSVPEPAKKAVATPAVRKPSPAAVQSSPLPESHSVPEVVEGNEQTDWALWEDSMTVLDSQMQGLTPSARIYERDKQTPSEFQDLDPFSRINKKSR
ncbi:MAG: hypothetical protein H7322_05440 [Ramlibacter sp.]|nr:hypothetical protein [Ramlibacter sp.]